MPRIIAYRAGGFTNCGIGYTKFSQEELAEMKDRVMTENEAIKELETSINLARMCTQNYERKREIQSYEMATNALEEVQKYREIGTPEQCRAAMGKQKPFKPETTRLTIGIGRCKCGAEFLDSKTNYCGNCGQRIDWGNGE